MHPQKSLLYTTEAISCITMPSTKRRFTMPGSNIAFLNELLHSIGARISVKAEGTGRSSLPADQRLAEACTELMRHAGEALQVAVARDALDAYGKLDRAGQADFFTDARARALRVLPLRAGGFAASAVSAVPAAPLGPQGLISAPPSSAASTFGRTPFGGSASTGRWPSRVRRQTNAVFLGRGFPRAIGGQLDLGRCATSRCIPPCVGS